MANSGSPFEGNSLGRVFGLGLVVFALFIVVGGVLWFIGSTLGLGTAASFFMAACIAPLLVAGVILLWVFSMSLERRQQVLGVRSSKSTEPGEGESNPQGPTQ